MPSFQWCGSYVDTKLGRVTSSGERTMKKWYPSVQRATDNKDSMTGKIEKALNFHPRCVACYTTKDPKHTRA